MKLNKEFFTKLFWVECLESLIKSHTTYAFWAKPMTFIIRWSRKPPWSYGIPVKDPVDWDWYLSFNATFLGLYSKQSLKSLLWNHRINQGFRNDSERSGRLRLTPSTLEEFYWDKSIESLLFVNNNHFQLSPQKMWFRHSFQIQPAGARSFRVKFRNRKTLL